MLTRITSLEKNINDLMELKNTAQELRKKCTSFNSQIGLGMVAHVVILELQEAKAGGS